MMKRTVLYLYGGWPGHLPYEPDELKIPLAERLVRQGLARADRG
jgi:hypothetical protein